MGDEIGWGMSSMVICFDFFSTNVVQLSNQKYVVYGRLTTIHNSLSLNPNRCHYPLKTYLSYLYLISKYNLFIFFHNFRYLEQSNWIISDEIEDTDDGTAEDEETKDESNADLVPSVPALQSENPDEKEACPVCR